MRLLVRATRLASLCAGEKWLLRYNTIAESRAVIDVVRLGPCSNYECYQLRISFMIADVNLLVGRVSMRSPTLRRSTIC